MLNNAILFIVLIFLMISSNKASAHSNHFDSYSYGIGYQALSIDKLTSESVGTGRYAHALGLSLLLDKQDPRHFSLGTDVLYMNDDSDLTETVRDTSTGEIKEKAQHILGYSVYTEGGLKHTVCRIHQLNIGISLGYRYNNIKRRTLECSGCTSRDISGFNNSAYIKGFVERRIYKRISGQLYITQPMGDTAFGPGIGLQVIFHSH